MKLHRAADSSTTGPSARTISVVGLAFVVAVGAVVATFSLGLNGDVQYVLGGLATHRGDEPLGFVRTFTHRPLAYRAILDVVLGLGSLVSVPVDDRLAFEAAVRAIGVVFAGVTGIIVWLGLRRRIDPLVAAGAGIGVGTSLALAPNFDFLQAEWLAAACAAAATGLAVGVRHPWIGASLAGILLTLAVAVKLSTVALAPAALLVIAAMDPRRAALTTGAALVAGTGWLAFSFGIRIEGQWLLDMVAASPGSMFDPDLLAQRIGAVLEVVGSKAAVTPIVVTVPASIALLTMRRRSGPRLAALLGGAVLLTLVPPFIQAPPNLYSLAPAHVLAAGLVGAAVARHSRTTQAIPWLALAPLAACLVVSLWSLTSEPEWLEQHRARVMAFAAVASLLGLVAARVLAAPSKPASSPSPGVGSRTLATIAIVATLAYLPTIVPAAAWALDPRVSPHSNAGWTEDADARAVALRALSDELGPDAEVLYLAYGTAPYGMGRPTPCRYPSPLFFRSVLFSETVAELPSFADNLRCLERADVEAILLEPGWMRMKRQPRLVRSLVQLHFDCAEGVEVGDYVLCPRRGRP